MSKTFAIAVYDGELTLEIIKADTLANAVRKHSKIDNNVIQTYHSLDYIKNILSESNIEVTEVELS